MLVTGGTGSFGQAFVRRCLADGARRVVVFSRGEAKQAAMRAELQDVDPPPYVGRGRPAAPRLRFLIGDVRDSQRLVQSMRGIEIVIHAAALKRVEVCEADPWEAVLTNIVGTYHVAMAAIACGVPRAVLLSTDKAASPSTLYGSTKLTAERLWCGANVYAAGTPTRFAASRYGNVVGSTGSVVPLWQAQAARDELLTVTDPSMTRFMMSMSAAVDLVVLALQEMRGGEVFVPKIGGATVGQLACAVAPSGTMSISGARPGEKRDELLISSDESRYAYDMGGHYVIEPIERTWETLPAPEGELVDSDFEYRSDRARPLTREELTAMVNA